IIHNSVENGLLVWPTVALENDTVRPKTYEELSDKEKLQADCDLKATNIVLQDLPPDVYALVNHHKLAKDIWHRVKLLMQGISLSKQELECKLYNEFAKFSYMKVQANTKFLNSLPPEWGKFITDVKLARDLHTNQATVQDGRVTVQQVQGRQGQNVVSLGEGYIARHYTQPKRRIDAAWFKEKVLLVQAEVEGRELDKEQLAFIADHGVADG
nr:hypothetical protein [Tanacetum cinerariifolium]